MDALETPDIRADSIDQDRATLSVVLEDCAGEPPGVGGQVGERYDRCSGDEVGGWRQVELPLPHLVRGEREVLVQAPVEVRGGVAVLCRAGQVGGVVGDGETGGGGDGEAEPGDESLVVSGSVESHHAGPHSVVTGRQAGQSELTLLVSGGEGRGVRTTDLTRPHLALLLLQPHLAPPLPARALPDAEEPGGGGGTGEEDLLTRHHTVHLAVHRGVVQDQAEITEIRGEWSDVRPSPVWRGWRVRGQQEIRQEQTGPHVQLRHHTDPVLHNFKQILSGPTLFNGSLVNVIQVIPMKSVQQQNMSNTLEIIHIYLDTFTTYLASSLSSQSQIFNFH